MLQRELAHTAELNVQCKIIIACADHDSGRFKSILVKVAEVD